MPFIVLCLSDYNPENVCVKLDDATHHSLLCGRINTWPVSVRVASDTHRSLFLGRAHRCLGRGMLRVLCCEWVEIGQGWGLWLLVAAREVERSRLSDLRMVGGRRSWVNAGLAGRGIGVE